MDLNTLGDNYPYINQYLDLAIRYAESKDLPIPIRLLDCGFMGCTFYTTDPGIVFKMTIDAAETSLYQKLCDKPEPGFAACHRVALAKPEPSSSMELPPNLIWREYVLPGSGLAFDETWVDHYLRFSHHTILDAIEMGESLTEAVDTYRYHLLNLDGSNGYGRPWMSVVAGVISLLDQGYVVEDIKLENVGMNLLGDVIVFDAQLLTLREFIEL